MDKMLELNKLMAIPDGTLGSSYYQRKNQFDLKAENFETKKSLMQTKSSNYSQKFAFIKELEGLIKAQRSAKEDI